MIRFISVVATGLLWGSAVWAQPLDLRNPRTEAEYLAIEKTGLLAPPQDLADLYEADIASIRSAFPVVAPIYVFPLWRPGDVLVDMTRNAYDDFKAGAFHGFDSLFASLGPPAVGLRGEHPAFTPGLYLAFNEVYHGQRLADLFAGVDGVTAAYPNGSFGDGDDINVREGRVYEFSHGFGDCPAGCIGRIRWRFRVSDVGVQAVPEPDALIGLAGAAFGLTRLARRWPRAA